MKQVPTHLLVQCHKIRSFFLKASLRQSLSHFSALRFDCIELDFKEIFYLISFKCDLCDFVSNREAVLKIHTTRKHATIEQLDSNIEDFTIDKSWKKDLDRNDDFIVNYLMTGEISPEITGYDIIEFKEILQFVLSPHSHQSRTLTSDQLGSEVLLLLESFKSRIEAKDGPGSFIHHSPWRDMVD